MGMSYSFLSGISQKRASFDKFEMIRVNIGSFKMEAEVIKRDVEDYNGILCVLQAPICAKIGDKVGICRQNKNKEWAFVAGGIIRKTKNIKVKSDQNKMQENKYNDDNEITQKDTAEKPKRKIKKKKKNSKWW